MNNEYYSLDRPEVFDMIINNPNSIVEFGCGFGELGKKIKSTWACNLIGVELNPVAKNYLLNYYDSYYIDNIENFNIEKLNQSFDCFIYADILEHLRNPEEILMFHLNFLKKNGQVIISIPNIRNLKIIYDLFIKGEWKYLDSGILDRTHYKFFTRKSILDMLNNVGLKVEKISSNKDKFRFPKNIVSYIPSVIIPDLQVCQWIIRARKL